MLWTIGAVAVPFDFLNLCVVRGFGQRSNDSVGLRVSHDLPWPDRAPNILMVAYVVARDTLPTLLSALVGVMGWRRHCTIDQALCKPPAQPTTCWHTIRPVLLFFAAIGGAPCPICTSRSRVPDVCD